MPPDKDTPLTCAKCGTPAAGSPADGWLFCARCGASLAATNCAACGADVAADASFCHRCGTAVAAGGAAGDSRTARDTNVAAARHSSPAVVPWTIAAIAFVALFAMLAGKGFNRQRGSTLDAPLNALPQAGLDFARPGAGGQAPVRASTDISRLSPEERADRLFNRVMQLNTEGKRDSVLFFAPMAISAYQMLGSLNADQRYDMGRIAEVAGALPLARAQADSILRENPSHLLGLVLAARVATLAGDTSALRRLESRMLTVERGELARALPEYQRHEADIMSALAQARRGAR